MGAHDDAEWFEPATLADWSDWLARHHAESTGVWLVRAKKATGRQAFDYESAVVEALRYGWIDAVQRVIDDERSRLWFAPRRRRSGWAASNKQRIARLEAEGRLEPAGRAAVEAAKADGTWSLLEELERLDVPDDLAVALDRAPGRPRPVGRVPGLGTPRHPGVDPDGQAPRDPGAPGRRDRREGRPRRAREHVDAARAAVSG